jgi:glycosyltransferase involved in cell wall biosynthesis
VIPSTVDTSTFDPSLDLPTDPDLPIDRPVIGTVVNVSPIKGLETLIRAAGHLLSRGYSPDVIIVGEIFKRQMNYQRRLIELSNHLGLSRLQFVGAKDDVRPFLKSIDIYVCSSNAESSPTSVWEAMAMARPIVSTDVGDVARHIVDGEDGFIVPVGDYMAMAEKIEQLLQKPELRTTFGQSFQKKSSVFSPKGVARETLQFYNKILTRDC